MAGHTPTATVPSSAQRQQQQAQRQAPPPPPPQQQQQQQLAPSAASAASDTSAADAAVPTLAPARRKLFGLGMENDRVALLAAAAASGVALAVGVGGLVASLVRRRRARRRAAAVANSVNGAPGPNSGLRATSRCVPLADGSACVVRRPIPADNSCLFNAVGYVMHHSKTKAGFLRSVVSREVSSDPKEFSEVFLGMSNVAYCHWIMDRTNWGGGIELSILAKHYGREISAWNIETAKGLVFGEDAGHPKRVMLIYNGIHYDALAISPGPKASESQDITEFNPRTKRGKMIIAAAQKLVDLTHKGSQFVSNSGPKMKLTCTTCSATFSGQSQATKHANETGHSHFEQVK